MTATRGSESGWEVPEGLASEGELKVPHEETVEGHSGTATFHYEAGTRVNLLAVRHPPEHPDALEVKVAWPDGRTSVVDGLNIRPL